jgi:hypothetical protein
MANDSWQTIAGSTVLIPPNPKGILHFLGGAFVAAAPQVTYRLLLEYLADRGYVIVATPFMSGFDHGEIAKATLNSFEQAIARLHHRRQLSPRYLPVYGLGHSMGCKLHLLIASLFEVERAGNIFLAYNNFPAKRSIPLLEQFTDTLSNPLERMREAARQVVTDRKLPDSLRDAIPQDWKQTLKQGLKQIDFDNFNPINLNTLDLNKLDLNKLEFVPSPDETLEIIAADYPIRRNLLVKFRDDEIDQTLVLHDLLTDKFGNFVSFRPLNGNHITPIGQDLRWQVGETFSPIDAVGQWMRQGVYQDLDRLKREIARWLDPTVTPV